jgi:preprotein translocase subunit SecE
VYARVVSKKFGDMVPEVRVGWSGGLRTNQLLQMNKITTYFRESYKELLEKVTWPTWPQLQQSTVIVLVATLLISFVVWIMDIISSSVLHFTYSLFS